ncbi:MAG: XTP/dITP diphosphatase [Thermoplasmata archaeon]
MRISFVTTNKGKFAEIGEMIRSRGHEPEHIPIAYPEMQADTLEMVVIQGMEWLRKRYDRPILVDDSGLFIDALRGFPGVYSAYAYKTLRCEGILRLMKGVQERSARFECVLGFAEPKKDVRIFKGVSEGTISESERGTKGFGFDPIFVPEGHSETFAELDMDTKNSISHRGRAFQKFFEYIGESSRG